MPSDDSSDALKIGVVLLLSFFVGLEREERKQSEAPYTFGGVRTFPLIGLVSYALALVSRDSFWPWSVGLMVVGGLMLLSYQKKLSSSDWAGVTTEISGVATYVIGGLVQLGDFWIAATIAIVAVLLLELKKGLEGLAQRVASKEIVTVTQFLLLTVVILPVVPDRDYTPFAINPYKTWLVVVAVCGVSFGSYVLTRVLKGRGGLMLSALLGGAYSSTVTTVVLARRSREDHAPNAFAGAILAASSVMYARLVVLVWFFDATLGRVLLPAFGVLALVGGLVGLYTSRRHAPDGKEAAGEGPEVNPLDLKAAVLFAGVFVGVLVLTQLARQHLGSAGLYGLAALMGVTDVDPFILGLTQTSSTSIPTHVAAGAIVIAASSNNVLKAIYALVLGEHTAGRRSAMLLLGLAALGLVPLVWFL